MKKSSLVIFLVLLCVTIFGQHEFWDGRSFIENDTADVFMSVSFGVTNTKGPRRSRPINVNLKNKEAGNGPFFKPVFSLNLGVESKMLIPKSRTDFVYNLLLSMDHIESFGKIVIGRGSVFDPFSFRIGGLAGVYTDRVFNKTKYSAKSEIGEYETRTVFGPVMCLGFDFDKISIIGHTEFLFSGSKYIDHNAFVYLKIKALNANFGILYEKSFGFSIQKYFSCGLGISAQVFTSEKNIISKGATINYSFD